MISDDILPKSVNDWQSSSPACDSFGGNTRKGYVQRARVFQSSSLRMFIAASLKIFDVTEPAHPLMQLGSVLNASDPFCPHLPKPAPGN